MANTYGTSSVGTSSVKVIAANTWRRGFNVYNAGTVACYVGFDSAMTTATGTTVLPTASFTSDGLSNYKGDVFMISGSAAQDIRYLEWTM